MLSKAQIKYIRSLTQQKYRKQHQVFLAEGDKVVREWLATPGAIPMIVALPQWVEQNSALLSAHPETNIITVTEDGLKEVSALQATNSALAVVATPAASPAFPGNEWCLALDGVQDPGNMGTIIRIADWFGIKHIVCSLDCVDVYNPKVVQAAMGSHLRVSFHHAGLGEWLAGVNIPILAATLDGTSVYEAPRHSAAVLIIGNESKGISASVLALATQKITIPRYGGAESLNAGVSAGILCALLVDH